MSTFNEVQEALISGSCRNVHQMAVSSRHKLQSHGQALMSPSNSTLGGTRGLESLPANCGKQQWERKPRGDPLSMSSRLWHVSHQFSLPGLSLQVFSQTLSSERDAVINSYFTDKEIEAHRRKELNQELSSGKWHWRQNWKAGP